MKSPPPLFYEEIFKTLQQHKVRYLLIGGAAVALHGYLRITADIDIMIALDQNNIKVFLQIMEQLGYKPKAPVSPEEFLDPQKREQWIKEKNMKAFCFCHPDKPTENIDVLIDNQLDFEKLYQNRDIKKARSIEIPVISIDDLIMIKKIAGRKQDSFDIEKLEEIKKLHEQQQ